MSRRNRVELDVTFGGQKLKATRTEYSIGGSDPTCVVEWKSERFQTQEFQGVINGTLDGVSLSMFDQECHVLVTIHNGLEGLHGALQFLDDREPDPIGSPSDYV